MAGMWGGGPWGWGLVVLLWAGCQQAEASPRHEEKVAMARPSAREVAPLSAPVAPEQARRGDPSWRRGKAAGPGELEVLTSAQTAQAGEQISVDVASQGAPVVRAEVFRLGVYGGAGALKVWSGRPSPVSTPATCSRAPGRARVSCAERMTFSFEIAEDWAPGLYLVKVTRSDGLRSFSSLVIQERKSAGPST